jgi:hypothetical protein
MFATNTPFRMRRHARRGAQIVGLMTLALLAGVAGRFYLDMQDFAQDRVVEVGASYLPYNSVADLTRDSDLVVLGHVMGEGTTHLVAQQAERPRPFQAPATSDLPESKRLATTPSQKPGVADTDAQTNGASTVSFDLPVTVYTIAVERVVHGAAQPSQLTVTQPGGKLRTPTFPGGPQITRTVQFEHDAPFQAGERHLLFLRAAGDGTYFVVGGPQGRLTIDRTEKVHPIDRAAPAARGREGQGVEALLSEVAAIR